MGRGATAPREAAGCGRAAVRRRPALRPDRGDHRRHRAPRPARTCGRVCSDCERNGRHDRRPHRGPAARAVALPVDDASAEAAARAVEQAGTLVDVAVASFDSPIGRLTLAATPKGLVRIGFHDEYVYDDLAERLSPRVVESPARLDTVRRQLDEYFDQRRRHFRFALDLSLSTGDFRRRALEAARRIPPGETATYGDLAAEAGNPAPRAPSAPRWPPTRSRSSFRATASSRRPVASATTAAASRSRPAPPPRGLPPLTRRPRHLVGAPDGASGRRRSVGSVRVDRITFERQPSFSITCHDRRSDSVMLTMWSSRAGRPDVDGGVVRLRRAPQVARSRPRRGQQVGANDGIARPMNPRQVSSGGTVTHHSPNPSRPSAPGTRRAGSRTAPSVRTVNHSITTGSAHRAA